MDYNIEVIIKEEPSSSDECLRELVPKKRAKRTPLTVNEKQIIVNLYKYLEQSSPQNERNKMRLHTKTADILNIGTASVYRILREHARNEMKAPLETKKRPLFSEKISEIEKSALRKKVYSFFENDQLPTGKKIMQAVNDDDSLPTFRRTTFQKTMKHLRFKYVRINAKNAMIDKDELVIWRRNYLIKIMQYRNEKRPIFYLDEGWINVEAQKSKSSTAKNNKKDIKRINIVHIGNENGFLPDAAEIFEPNTKNYGDPMTAGHFECWFENTVKKLGDNAVVVLDDAPHHSRRIDKLPTSNWTKASIQEWLLKRDIQFTDDDVKAQLLDKVCKLNLERRTYAVDEIAKKYKVEVLRLPPFHYDLNPMASVLSEITEQVMKNKFDTLDKAHNCLKNAVDKFPDEKWARHVERAKEEEVYYYKINDIIDNVVDKYITLNPGSDTSDDGSGSNSDDD
ncbi:uncharacterized protein isoform X2 [Choristoneura fumiferana]|uniref:uncharacterized protein isoform X2 n=1 Tax=Choristoneura fumiferana TaxID=7141 RepID=UPI003D153F56